MSRLPPFTLPLLLFLGVPWTSPAVAADAAAVPGFAPWDGIVGFLRTVAALQERRPEPESAEESDGQPLRKIVYAVEEQVSEADESHAQRNTSAVVYDSLRDTATATPLPPPAQSVDLAVAARSKRSSPAAAAAATNATAVGGQSGRDAAGGRPFFIGRKLWYVPLWFGLYLILYITALTVKSVARHRIKYPTLVSEDDLAKRRNGATRRVSSAISNTERRYQQWNM